jgi:hypothetical protein
MNKVVLGVTLGLVMGLMSSTAMAQMSVRDMMAKAVAPTEATTPNTTAPSAPEPVKPEAAKPAPPVVTTPVVTAPVAPTVAAAPAPKTQTPPAPTAEVPETLQSLPPTITAPVADADKNKDGQASSDPQATGASSKKVKPEIRPIGDEVPRDIRASIENDFKEALTFPLTETKMVAYVRAANKVEKINNRWDVEIAAAETDQMAVENNNFAVEDINAALSTMRDLTLKEYSEMTVLTSKDVNFARLVKIYRQLLAEGIFGTADKPIEYQVVAPVVATPAPTPATNTQGEDRIAALQKQIAELTEAVKKKHEAAAMTANDPVTAAQMEAMTAKIKTIGDKLDSVDKRSSDIEGKVKTQ